MVFLRGMTEQVHAEKLAHVLRESMRVALTILMLLAAPQIDIHDLEGTQGRWQEGIVTVAAPIERVRELMGDYAHWAQNFSDIESAEIVSHDGADFVVRFRSRILDREMLAHIHETPTLVTFASEGANVHAQGRMYYIDLGSGRTRVIIQSTATLHGGLRLAPRAIQRRRAQQKIRADLEGLIALTSGTPPARLIR